MKNRIFLLKFIKFIRKVGQIPLMPKKDHSNLKKNRTDYRPIFPSLENMRFNSLNISENGSPEFEF
jgi:hypothetical protein